MSKKIIITEIAGITGSALAEMMIAAGYEVIGLTKDPEKHSHLSNCGIKLMKWNGTCPEPWFEYAENCLAIINLAGTNISSTKWTPEVKELIKKTRISSIQAIDEAIKLVDKKPELVIQASHVGFYGYNSNEVFNEKSPVGEGYIAEVFKEVENEVTLIDKTDVKIVRFGVVMARSKVDHKKRVHPMRLGCAFYPGNGKNSIPWVHIHDAINAIRFIIEKHPNTTIFNITSPERNTLKEISYKSVKIRKRLFCLPAPVFMLKRKFGKEMTKEVLMANRTVNPDALHNAGFVFHYPTIDTALKELLAPEE